jgi:hypothetical protein
MGREQDHLKQIVEESNFVNCTVLSEHQGIVGFYTHESNKKDMFQLLHDRVTYGLLEIAASFITINRDPNRQSSAMIERLFKEMENLKDYTVTTGTHERRIITGVLDSNLKVIRALHDDLVMALVMLFKATALLFKGRLLVDPVHVSDMYHSHQLESFQQLQIDTLNSMSKNNNNSNNDEKNTVNHMIDSNPFAKKRANMNETLDLTVKKGRFDL